MRPRGWSILGYAWLGMAWACSRGPEPQPPAPPPLPEPALQPVAPEPAPVAAASSKDVYFGNLHVHTSYSFDAVTNGAVVTPDDAYRWAQGEPIPAGVHGGALKIKRPLDWYAVSDHAEYLGVFKKMFDPNHPASKLPIAKDITSKNRAVSFKAFARVLDGIATGKPDPALSDKQLGSSIWKEMVATADKHNKPGRFTTFPAFEWTAQPNGLNLHRVVLFESSQGVPDRPLSALDTNDPLELWKWLDQVRAHGATVLAVPHNGNASDGLMFPTTDAAGAPLDATYAERRASNEPLYEITQIKGTSETHPILSPNDEFAGFELWDYLLGSTKVEAPRNKKGSYARQALLDGMALQQAGQGNPYQFGFIGDSDTHNAASAVEEDNYTGKFGMEGTPKHRLDGPIPGDEVNNKRVREFSSGGLAAIWAESNTREAIFAAMKRRETYATSGTRMKLRVYGGWTFSPDMLSSGDWVARATASGVPMGGVLPKSTTGKAPTLIVHAMKDPDGANLDRIQIIKGWIENGEQREMIYDVAVSGGRKRGADGKMLPVGSTVDVAKATYTNTIGEPELSASWSDPDFDAAEPAFYYARVIEVPTPRWSTYDAVRLGVKPRPDLPSAIQERGWSSPIWYEP